MATENLKEMRDVLRTMQTALRSLSEQMGVLSDKIDKMVVVCEEDKTAELTCVDPFYESCPNNPDTCVHKLIPEENKREVCGIYGPNKKIGKNAVVRFPGELSVKLSESSRISSEETNFPVAHARTLALNKRDIKGMDPKSFV